MSAPVELKAVLAGDTNAGKTSLCMRFVHGEAATSVQPTIGELYISETHTFSIHVYST
jgi:GTPase SAR1 family protein